MPPSQATGKGPGSRWPEGALAKIAEGRRGRGLLPRQWRFDWESLPGETAARPVLRGNAGWSRASFYVRHGGDGSMNFYPRWGVVADRWKSIGNPEPALGFSAHIGEASGDVGHGPRE